MMNKAEKVLILGGAGTMGGPLCRFLIRDGYEVCVTSRQKRADANGIKYFHGNAQDISFIRQLLQSETPDVIVDFMDYRTDVFRRHINLLLSNCKHYLFLSSYRVYADESMLTEESSRLLNVCQDREYLSTDEYALHKARSEDLLFQSAYKNWTILRPGIIYSNGCFKFGCLEANTVMYRALKNLPVVMPRDMLCRTTTLTWSEDAARLISKLVLNPLSYCNVYNVSSGERSTWSDVAKIYEEAAGLNVQDISLKAYCEICNRYQVIYDRMFNRALDNKKILRDTKITQQELTPMSIGLRREIIAFSNKPTFKGVNVHQNAIIDKVCKSHIGFSDFTSRQVIEYYCYRYLIVGLVVSFFRKLKNLLVR